MSKATIAITLFLLLNLYVAARIIGRSTWAEQHNIAAWSLAVLFVILQLIGPFGDRLLFPELRHKASLKPFITAIDWASYAAIGIMSCLFIYIVMADVVGILWRFLAQPDSTVNFERRTLFTLGAATAATMAMGVQQAASGPQVKSITIPLKNLPVSFEGFTIAQITDLHVGPLIDRSYTENVVRITAGLNADLIVLTGDFIDGSVEDIGHAVAPLGDLTAPYGAFFITGNHEYYWGAAQWIEEFKRLGSTVLNNEHRVLRRGDDEIILAGVTDYSTRGMGAPHAFNPMQSLAGAPENRVKILLAHQPASYEEADKAGFDLQISGHTHAGQYFPFSLFIGLFQRYYKGLNRHNNMWIYVSSGTGYWGPPMRTANPSEITLIILARAV